MGTVTAMIFGMGIATVVLSAWVAIVFSRQHKNTKPGNSKRLTFALKWQLIGEAIIGLGTLIFATAAHFNWLPDWSSNLQSAIRFVMFAATSLTTFHLWQTMRHISENR